MADISNKLNSANYITVKVTDNPITNGNNLLAAYALAKNTNPNGITKSATNRLSIILPVAIYDLGTQSLTLDTQYIDIIGATNDRNNHYIKSNVGVISKGTIIQTANDVKLYNLTIQNSNTTYSINYANSDPAAYFPNTNLNLVYVENVKFLSNNINAWSMRIVINYSGTFTNCTGGDYSFGGGSGGTISGTLTNCTGGNSSFAGSYSIGGGTINGTLTNCTGGDYSFGGGPIGGTISGTLTNCIGLNYSFASGSSSGGTISESATLTNCTGGGYSFAGGGSDGGTINGTLTNCTGGGYSFAGGGSGGGTINGTLTNCTGGGYSFACGNGGGNGGTINGTLKDCKGEVGSFASGGYSNGGTISESATLTNCTGGDYSFASFTIPGFGGNGTISGTLKDCKGGVGSFANL